MRKILIFTFVAIAMNSAGAHTKLTASEPEANAIVQSPVADLHLEFAKAVRLVRVVVEGHRVKQKLIVPKASSKTFSLAMDSLARGDYQVRWIALGRDGHKMKGDFSFIVQAK